MLFVKAALNNSPLSSLDQETRLFTVDVVCACPLLSELERAAVVVDARLALVEDDGTV